jgi:hypothetical protein
MILGWIIASCSLVSTAWPQSARQIAENAFRSVVVLVLQDAGGRPVSLGSGFFVREGVVATNMHVIEGAASGYAKLVAEKTKHDIAGIVANDPAHDLVLLAVANMKAPPLVLGDARDVAVGDEVYAVGNPRGLEGTFSQGIVSSVRQVGADTLLQITAPISPGSSGGPVLDSQGKVVGVAVATFKGGQNLNFAIPASYLAALLANTNSSATFPLGGRSRREKSILDGLGNRSAEGVTGSGLIWEGVTYLFGDFSFTLQNHLREPVRDIYCLVIFYDKNENPLDFALILYPELIPGGLGKRVTGKVEPSVKRLTTPPLPNSLSQDSPSTRVEFRVLDFQLVD